jgi:hypothetical protein
MMSLLFALIMSVGIVSAVQAGPVTIGDPLWYEFAFGGVGSLAEAGAGTIPSSGGNSQWADDPPWTFTGAGILTVVDAFWSVDRFQIFDGGVSIGYTSSFTEGGSDTSDPEVALLEMNYYSRGIFDLGTGSHSITILHTEGVSGAGYFRVAAVPEPTTLLLLGFGLLGLAGLRRKE